MTRCPACDCRASAAYEDKFRECVECSEIFYSPLPKAEPLKNCAIHDLPSCARCLMIGSAKDMKKDPHDRYWGTCSRTGKKTWIDKGKHST